MTGIALQSNIKYCRRHPLASKNMVYRESYCLFTEQVQVSGQRSIDMSKRNNKKGPTGSAVDKEIDALFVAPRRSPVRHHPSIYGDEVDPRPGEMNRADPHPGEKNQVGDDGSFRNRFPGKIPMRLMLHGAKITVEMQSPTGEICGQ
jgi:hypothetical protein